MAVMTSSGGLNARWLPTETASGARNMALDEALLIASRGPAARVYRWQPPAVSLGCFQDFSVVTASLPRAMPVVRRITGGGAIWHADEVTYALCYDASVLPQAPQSTATLYAPLHAAILAQLRRRGCELERQQQARGDKRYRDEPRCFASPAIDDLVRGTGKILGSAARARGSRILVHGSLKLDGNDWDGAAVAGCGLSRTEAEAAIAAAVRDFLGVPFHDDEWSAEELQAADAIERARYGDALWVEQRAGLRP